MARRPQNGEKYEARLQLILPPSLREKVIALSNICGVSINQFCVNLLAKTADKNAVLIENFLSAREKFKSSFQTADVFDDDDVVSFSAERVGD